jgi:RNA polymerase sigma factor (sigma-70 family)
MTERVFLMRREADDNPDLALMQAIASGDSVALRLLYEKHGLHLLNYLIARLDNRSLAEEVLQDVMLAVWQGAGRFCGRSQVRTWLFAIARRQAAKAIRRKRFQEFANQHVVDGLYNAGRMRAEGSVPAGIVLGGNPINVDETNSGLLLNGRARLLESTQTTTGLLHIIDQPLSPLP